MNNRKRNNKLLYKLTAWMLTNALIRAIFWTYCYIKDWRAVEESLHGDAFRVLLKKYLKMDRRIDWLGRVYGVVNPSINEHGEFDYNGMVFELDGVNTSTNTWVENWLYKQMILVSNVFDINKTGFFDIISADIRHVGPENADNFLIVFDIVARQEMAKRWKRVFWQAFAYAAVAATALLIIL